MLALHADKDEPRSRDILEVLLEHNPDCCVPDRKGYTPLHYACQTGKFPGLVPSENGNTSLSLRSCEGPAKVPGTRPLARAPLPCPVQAVECSSVTGVCAKRHHFDVDSKLLAAIRQLLDANFSQKCDNFGVDLSAQGTCTSCRRSSSGEGQTSRQRRRTTGQRCTSPLSTREPTSSSTSSGCSVARRYPATQGTLPSFLASVSAPLASTLSACAWWLPPLPLLPSALWQLQTSVAPHFLPRRRSL